MNIKSCFIKHKGKDPVNLLNCVSFSKRDKNELFYVDFFLVYDNCISWCFDTKTERDETHKNIYRRYADEVFDEV